MKNTRPDELNTNYSCGFKFEENDKKRVVIFIVLPFFLLYCNCIT